MPDLIHFCTEATKEIKSLKESYDNLKKYHNGDILSIEIVYPYKDTVFMCGTIWCEDAGLPPWEISSILDLKFKTMEPFFIHL